MRKEVRFTLFGTGILLNIKKGLWIAVLFPALLAGISYGVAVAMGVPATVRLLVSAALCGFIGGPVSILLHEFAHVRAARRFGIPMTIFIEQRETTTSPVFPEHHRMRPVQRIIFSLAGPFASAVEATLLFALAVLSDSPDVGVISWASVAVLVGMCMRSLRGQDGYTFWRAARQLRQKRT